MVVSPFFFFFFCDVGSRVVFWNATCQFGSVWQSHGRGALEDSRDESFEELCVRTGRGSFTSRDWRRRKFKVISLEWWRANARNVSFGTLYGGQFTFSTQLIILNYPDILSHRRSTTISLETYPPLFLFSHPALSAYQLRNSPFPRCSNPLI